MHSKDAVYRYRRSGVVCVLVKTVSPAETAEPIEMQFGCRLAWAQGTVCYMGARIVATWRIR